MAPVFASVALRVLRLSVGALFFAVRDYPSPGDKASADAPIFVAAGSHGAAYLLGP